MKLGNELVQSVISILQRENKPVSSKTLLGMIVDEEPRFRDFFSPNDVADAGGEKTRIRSMVFTGFKKCLSSLQKFDSDPERTFSALLDREDSVLKWFKPTLSNLRLWYGANEYTPDFVVETDTEKLLCEVKALGQVDDAVVQSKKKKRRH